MAYKLKKLALIVLVFLLFLVAYLSPYPKSSGEWFRIRYDIAGNLECLTTGQSSAVDIFLTKNEIDIRDIRVTKLCDFDEGYVDFEITGLKGEPYIYELNEAFYSINKTGNDTFRINLNSDLMGTGYADGSYSFSIKSKISNKFDVSFPIYEISSNTKPWAVFFDYPASLFGGYSCDECFALLEGNLRIVHPDNKIYETGNIGDKRFYFEDEDRILIIFNPKSKLREFLLDISKSIIAAILTFFLLEYNKKK